MLLVFEGDKYDLASCRYRYKEALLVVVNVTADVECCMLSM